MPARHRVACQLRQALDREARTAVDSLLIAEWMEQGRVYDLRIDSVQVARGTRGVQLTVVGQASTEGDDGGVVGMSLELAALVPQRGAPGTARTQSVSVRTGAGGRFVAQVPFDVAPTSVTVDPRYRWIDRNRSNNTKTVGPRAP